MAFGKLADQKGTTINKAKKWLALSMATKLAQSLENGPHKLLQGLIGDWRGTTKTWFEQDVLADESPMSASISALYDGRFVSYDYQGSLEGKPFEGKMIIGYDIPYQRFTTSWIDTFHMGSQIMLSNGEAKENGFAVRGSYGSPEYGEPWGWRTELEIVNAEEIIVTAYNISPAGEEAKATETVYQKVSQNES